MRTKKKVSTPKVKVASIAFDKDYFQTLEDLKHKIRQVQLRASLSVNQELIKLYWEIGRIIVEKQEKNSWGTKVIESFAKDLQKAFPGIQGFSRANIFYARAFYLSYKIVQQAVGQLGDLPFFNIPWGHNIVLITKLKSNDQRIWYAKKAIEEGWSRRALELMIKSNLYSRQGKAITNFEEKFPSPQSYLAQDILKSPYNFDFLTLATEYDERELEEGLVSHIQKFLIELGKGFAFVGRQYHIEVEGKDYYIDLLFYHTKLHCYVPIELKAQEFKPEFAGKMNFYLAAVDAVLKSEQDNPSIGMILCESKSKLIIEYAFRNCTTPIGVACYETKVTPKVPKELRESLPTVEQIEAEFKSALALKEKKKSHKGSAVKKEKSTMKRKPKS